MQAELALIVIVMVVTAIPLYLILRGDQRPSTGYRWSSDWTAPPTKYQQPAPPNWGARLIFAGFIGLAILALVSIWS